MEWQIFNDTVRVFQPLTINFILSGNDNWSIKYNNVLFRAVTRYKHARKRFDNILTPCLKFPFKHIFICKYKYTMTNLYSLYSK